MISDTKILARKMGQGWTGPSTAINVWPRMATQEITGGQEPHQAGDS